MLADRAELQELLRKRNWQPLIVTAAAAALLTVALGLWTWRHASVSRASVMANVATDFLGHSALPVDGRFVLIRRRGETPVVDIELPEKRSAIQLRILPSVFAELGRYRVTLERVGSDDRRSLLQQLSETEAASDRFITVYLDSSQLAPGSYEMSMVGIEPTLPASEEDRFALRVRKQFEKTLCTSLYDCADVVLRAPEFHSLSESRPDSGVFPKQASPRYAELRSTAHTVERSQRALRLRVGMPSAAEFTSSCSGRA